MLRLLRVLPQAWHPTALSYVMKPVYQKAIPRRGDKSGWLLVKVIQTKSERSRRVSLRKAAQKEMRKFAVLEGTVLTTFTNSTPSATEHKRINLKDVSNIAIKSGALDSKDFVIHLAKEEVHISATSASESKKWVKVLVRAKNLIVGAFGSATNASMVSSRRLFANQHLLECVCLGAIAPTCAPRYLPMGILVVHATRTHGAALLVSLRAHRFFDVAGRDISTLLPSLRSPRPWHTKSLAGPAWLHEKRKTTPLSIRTRERDGVGRPPAAHTSMRSMRDQFYFFASVREERDLGHK